MPHKEESRKQEGGIVNSGGKTDARKDDHFLSDLDEMSILLNENQQDLNMRERNGLDSKRTLVELDQLGGNHNAFNGPRISISQYGLLSPKHLGTTCSQEVEDTEPVEVRLLAALQKEMGLSIGTASLAQLVPSTPIITAPTSLANQKRGGLSDTTSDFFPSSMVSLSSLVEYRNVFPPKDVANLQEYHWPILKYVIPPRTLGLGRKDVEISSRESKPSSAALDEMIEHLSGATKVTCLNFREAQKRTWRKGQQKCRAIARANKTSRASNPRVAQLRNSAIGASRVQDRPYRHMDIVQSTLYESPGHHRDIHLRRENPFPQRAAQHRSFHPLTRSNSYILPRGIGQQRIMPIMTRLQDRFPETSGHGHTGCPRPNRPSIASRPTLNLPDPLLLPRMVLPLSEEEQAHVRRWMIRRDW